MGWSDIVTDMASDLLVAHGETVTLPGGVAATAIVDATGQPDMLIGEYGGVESRMARTPDPVARISASDGAALVEGDRIVWRGTDYLVSRIDQDTEFADWLRVEMTKTS